MVSSHETCFSLKVYAYIKYGMIVDLLIYGQLLNRSRYCLLWVNSVNPLSRNLYLTHLIIECPWPVTIYLSLAKPQCLLDSLGQKHPKLLCSPPILVLRFGYDPIPPPQYFGNPPSKLRIVLYTICNRIFCDFVWV